MLSLSKVKWARRKIETVERYARFVWSPRNTFNLMSAQLWFSRREIVLANYIFPQLNELCSSRGTHFKAVDLRWSASEAQTLFAFYLFRQHFCLHSQHLKLCLDFVSRRFSFFICLLGQTYVDFLPDCSPFTFSKATDLSNLSIVRQNLYVAAEKQNKTKPKPETVILGFWRIPAEVW